MTISFFYLMLGWIVVYRFQRGCERVSTQKFSPGELGPALQECYASMWPSVAQIKPFHRDEASVYSYIKTFVHQDYPGKQRVILSSAEDMPGLDVDSLRGNSNISVSWSKGSLDGANRKISSVAVATEGIEEDYIVISDADMIASPDLLRRAIQPFACDEVGMVTFLYIVRHTKSWGDIWEGINVADFAVSVLVARQVEGISFGLGAVMAIRRSVLEELGGLKAFKDYLADDYQLGNQIFKRGYKVLLADSVVENATDGSSFKEYFIHQLRWMRTYRCSRPGGFFAYIVTQGLFWTLLLVIASQSSWWSWAIVSLWALVRAWWCSSVWLRLKGGNSARYGVLAVFKDIIYLVLWVSALFGSNVIWSGEKFKIGTDGKMVKV